MATEPITFRDVAVRSPRRYIQMQNVPCEPRHPHFRDLALSASPRKRHNCLHLMNIRRYRLNTGGLPAERPRYEDRRYRVTGQREC
jgi:hypothetical protein